MRHLSREELQQVSGGTETYPNVVVDDNTLIINYGQTSTIYYADPSNYSTSGDVYYSEDGMAFQNFEACVNYYADLYHDQAWDDGSNFIRILGVVETILGNGEPTAEEYEDAAETCGC